MAFVVLKDASVMGDEPCCSSKSAIMKRVDGDLGAVARPARVRLSRPCPKPAAASCARAIQAV
jgi:propionyl-CoA synthetase